MGWKVYNLFAFPLFESYLLNRIRLYSTRTFKPLGTLKYHKSACQCVEFARSGDRSLGIGPRVLADDDDDEFAFNEKEDRTRWLLGGGKDNRVTVWSLISFEKF